MKLIDGSNMAKKILVDIESSIHGLATMPKLGIIQIGTDDATNIYVSHKAKDAQEIGMIVEIFHQEDSTHEELIEIITNLNNREDIDGFIIQFPLPVEGDIRELLLLIDPAKDVDGLNPLSLGKAWQGNKATFLPATVLGVMECLKHVAIFEDGMHSVNEIDSDIVDKKLSSYIQGKDIVIINNSIIIGKPLAAVLTNMNATVTLCHKFTTDLKKYTQNADIVITATGQADLINGDIIKENAVLIDVGISRFEGKVKGDVDFESTKEKASWITPVPGGVGPLTRAMLLWNTWIAYKSKNQA